MKFSRRREMSLVKPEMSLVKFQNVPGKCLEGVATLKGKIAFGDLDFSTIRQTNKLSNKNICIN